MTISPRKMSLKAECAVGSTVVIFAGWFSGSYSIAVHQERFRQLQELQVRNWELSRSIFEQKRAAETKSRRPDLALRFKPRISNCHK